MTNTQTFSEINELNVNNTNFKFEIGKKYHIRNGFTIDKKYLWLLNSKFIGYTYEHNGDVELLQFENNNVYFFVDSSMMFNYSKLITLKCWQFIPSGDK